MPDNQFCRDATDRLTFEMFKLPVVSYPAVCSAIVNAFQLVPEGTLITNGMDVLIRDYRRGDQVIEIAWDNWSGLIVIAKSLDSEPLVFDVGNWLLNSEWATTLGDQESE